VTRGRIERGGVAPIAGRVEGRPLAEIEAEIRHQQRTLPETTAGGFFK